MHACACASWPRSSARRAKIQAASPRRLSGRIRSVGVRVASCSGASPAGSVSSEARKEPSPVSISGSSAASWAPPGWGVSAGASTGAVLVALLQNYMLLNGLSAGLRMTIVGLLVVVSISIFHLLQAKSK